MLLSARRNLVITSGLAQRCEWCWSHPSSTVRGTVSCLTCFLGVPNRRHHFRQTYAYHHLSWKRAWGTAHRSFHILMELLHFTSIQHDQKDWSLIASRSVPRDRCSTTLYEGYAWEWPGWWAYSIKAVEKQNKLYALCHLHRCICMIAFVYAYCWGNKWFGEPGTCIDPVFSHGVLMHTSIYKSFLLAVLFIFVLTFLSTDSVKGKQKSAYYEGVT